MGVKLYAAFMSAALLLLIVLGRRIPPGAQTRPDFNVVHRNGTLSASESWTANNIYWIDGDLTVPDGVSLTVAPGVIIKFDPYKRLIVSGALWAVGNTEEPIYFTSIKDDVGGDTNGDGAASSPARFDWAWIEARAGSQVTLDYATVRYSGYRWYNYASTNQAALYAAGYAVPVLGSNVTLTDNWVNGIELPGGSLPVGAYTFPHYTAAAYYVPDDLTIPADAQATVEPGAVWKFPDGVRLIVSGVLWAVGSAEEPICFTSIKDDVGGDTNGDGDASSPARFDWAWIEVWAGSQVTLDYATVRYGGYRWHNYADHRHAILYAVGYTVPTLGDGVLLTDNWMNGIELPGGSLPVGAYTFPHYSSAAYYLRDDLTIPADAQVTVEPGAVWKFPAGARLIVNGTLSAMGELWQRIYFTSIKDDTGGDTNSDGGASSPCKEDWGWVEVGVGSQVTLSYATVRYGGYRWYNYADYRHAVLYAPRYTIPTLGDGVLLTDNWVNGIELPGGSLPVASYTFPHYPTAAYYVAGDLTIPSDVRVTIEPGAVWKFPGNTRLFVNGTLSAVGELWQRIYFTSIKDDTGGDTNSDGGASSPAPQDWGWIEIEEGSRATLDHVTVCYSGHRRHNNVDTRQAALYARGGTISATNVLLHDNYIGLESDVPANVAIHGSSITGNELFGVRNNQDTWLDASDNWWGDASGPLDMGTGDGSGNPGGAGDEVNDYVNYDPWSMAPPWQWQPTVQIFLPIVVVSPAR